MIPRGAELKINSTYFNNEGVLKISHIKSPFFVEIKLRFSNKIWAVNPRNIKILSLVMDLIFLEVRQPTSDTKHVLIKQINRNVWQKSGCYVKIQKHSSSTFHLPLKHDFDTRSFIWDIELVFWECLHTI